MFYVLADWLPSDEGYHADLPPSCGYLCLAGSSAYANFGLFKVAHPPDEYRDAILAKSVPASLARLLASASQYPPALAGAVHSLEMLQLGERVAFLAELDRLLRNRLDGQRSALHVMIRSLVNEWGYRDWGEYVWEVGYRPEAVGREVSWLASDYQVYSDAVTSFDVDPAWLAERFGKQNQALQQMAGAEGLSQVRSSHGVHR